jgi:type II secretory pathway pseudopilin PulG
VLYVWIALVVVALVVLGSIAFSLLGALQRLRREVAGLQQAVAPLVAQAQAVQAARAADTPAHPQGSLSADPQAGAWHTSG